MKAVGGTSEKSGHCDLRVNEYTAYPRSVCLMNCSCRTFLEEHLARPWCFLSGALMWIPETPPEHLPLDCHTRAGFSLANEPA
jgi:hypothetical protein